MSELSIAFIADGGFFLPSVVALTSLLENKKKDSKYHIYFVIVDFSKEQKDVLRKMANDKRVTLEFVEIKADDMKKKYEGIAKHECCASVSALIKFDLPYICDKIDKLLYLDGDIIVQSDLSKLADTDFMENEYAAVVEDSGILYNKNLIKQNTGQYFNSGVMLLNLDALRKDGIPERLIQEKMKDTDNSLMDQHVLNKVFKEHIKLLPHKYNVLYINLIRAKYFYTLSIEDVNCRYHTEYEAWDEMRDGAFIIHYSSFDKPWKYSDVTGVEIWDSYYSLSPLGNEKLKRKKLHIPLLNKMREKRGLALPASFIWECETKGFGAAVKDVFRFLGTKNE